MRNEYEIGDRVYHISGEGSQGIITDWRYYRRGNIFQYYVTWSHLDSSWCDGIELQEDKVVT